MTNKKQNSLTQFKKELLEISKLIDLTIDKVREMEEKDEIDEILSNKDMKKI